MNPKLSIIVPIYKVEQYLPKCIDSILAQTFTDFELILVNDGSPDNCGRICDKYAKKDKRVIVVHKKNGGVSTARNAGIHAAKGEYIGFVDSDDVIHEKMYEILYKNASLYSSDLVVCDFFKTEVNNSVDMKTNIQDYHVKKFSNIEALHQLFPEKYDSYATGAGNSMKWVVLWNKLYKRELFKQNKFLDGRICEDEFIMHRILFCCKKVIYLTAPLYYYVQSPNSIIRSSFSKERLDKVYALKDRADFFVAIKESSLHHKAFKSYIGSFFWNYNLAKTELKNAQQELKQLKNIFTKSVLLLLKNPIIGWKQKVYSMLFVINPFV